MFYATGWHVPKHAAVQEKKKKLNLDGTPILKGCVKFVSLITVSNGNWTNLPPHRWKQKLLKTNIISPQAL